MRVAFALLACLVIVLSGCLAGSETEPQSRPPGKRIIIASAPNAGSDDFNRSLSQPRFSDTNFVKEDFWHTSWDGVQLHTRIYRPMNTHGWKAPIILHMSPYFGPNTAATNVPTGNGLDGWLVKHFVPRGYAVALNDVRGTGESGGCLEQTGPKQTKDGYKVVEDLAALDWSNGKVGMIGISYDGETQQSTATAAPPHLTTIIPMSSVAGQYEWNFYDGVPYTTNGIVGMGAYMAIGIEPPTPPVGFVSGGGGGKLTNYAERWDCHPENLKEGADPRGDFNQYWKDREIRINVDKIHNTSVLYVHGLEDWNVKPNHIRNWFEKIPTEKHAWLGQWQHNYPDGNSFKREWSRTDWRLTVHRWYDHWLLGLDTGIMREPSVQVQDSMGRWRYEDAWPPAELGTLRLYASPESKLEVLPTRDGRLSYADNGLSMDTRGGSVSFVTEPLGADLHYAGWPLFNFTAIVAQPNPMASTHFALHLIDVSNDGTERMINRGYLSALHRNTIERSEPVPLGQEVEYRLRLFPQDDVVQAGHRLKIRIGAVDGSTQPDGSNAQVTLVLGGEKAYLDIPVVDDAQARFFTPIHIEPEPPLAR